MAQMARAATSSWRSAAANEAMYSPIASGNGGYAGKIKSIRIFAFSDEGLKG